MPTRPKPKRRHARQVRNPLTPHSLPLTPIIPRLDPVQIGRRIRQRRRQLKLTQTDLAKLIHNKHPSVIQRFEFGQRTPSLRQMVAICWALNLPIDSVLWG